MSTELPVTTVPLPPRLPGAYGGPLTTDGSNPTANSQSLTPYGQQIVQKEKETRQAIDQLPDYMTRLLRMSGTNYQIAASSAFTDGIGKGKCFGGGFVPAENRIDIPITSCLANKHSVQTGDIDIKAKNELLTHESRHAEDWFLGKLLYGGKQQITQHPLFVTAYEMDLQNIPNRQNWPMSLDHFVPKEKGGEYRGAHNGNITSRRETFAEVGWLIRGGENRYFYDGADHSQSWPPYNNYSDALKKLFPNTIAVATKFDHDLDLLSKQNPDDENYRLAVKSYLDAMPNTPEEYLRTTDPVSTTTVAMGGLTPMQAPPPAPAQVSPPAPAQDHPVEPAQEGYPPVSAQTSQPAATQASGGRSSLKDFTAQLQVGMQKMQDQYDHRQAEWLENSMGVKDATKMDSVTLKSNLARFQNNAGGMG